MAFPRRSREEPFNKQRFRRLKTVYPGGTAHAVAALFPGPDTVYAYQLLFGTLTGMVPDGLADLGVDDLDWAGDGTVLLEYLKGRTSAESLILPRAAARILEQWLAHSALLRQFAPEEMRGHLWLRYCPRGGARWSSGRATQRTRARWVRRHGLTDAGGRPWQLHAHRLRTTFEASRDRRSWRGSGRATIDPNHTPQVEGDHYLAGQTPRQKDATEAVIEGAQHDLVRRTHTPIVLNSDDSLAGKFPELVDQLKVDDAVLTELLGGERDVFAAGCADQFAGLHGPKGKPCPARPWVCLLCPLAVFTPRHLPNLMRLRAFFARQWHQLPTAAFLAVFGRYAERLDEILSPSYFPEEALRQAAAHVEDHDGEVPLRPEEATA